MKNQKILKLAQTAILLAILIVMNFTPLGFLPIGLLRLSLLMIPVAIGAVIVGPGSSTVLGLAFGIMSFATCFGSDPFGVFIMGISPVATFCITVVARVLCGVCTGYLFVGVKKLLEKTDKHAIAATVAACIAAPLLNALFFLGALLLFFGGNADVAGFIGQTVMAFVLATLVTNTIWEVLACAVIGSAICVPLKIALKK